MILFDFSIEFCLKSRNGYDKLRHDESVITEVLLVGTTALSGLTSYMNQYWGKRMADIVQKTDLWDDVARSKTLYITQFSLCLPRI